MALIQRKEKEPLIEQSEQAYINALASLTEHIRRYDLMLPNAWVTEFHEADLLAIRPSGFMDEFEVKLSRADFLADRKKTLSYNNEGDNFKLSELESGNTDINNFWYVVSKGLIDINDIPHFAGIIEIDHKVRIVRHPKMLHSRKASFETRYKFSRKASNKFWKLRLTSTIK